MEMEPGMPLSHDTLNRIVVALHRLIKKVEHKCNETPALMSSSWQQQRLELFVTHLRCPFYV